MIRADLILEGAIEVVTCAARPGNPGPGGISAAGRGAVSGGIPIDQGDVGAIRGAVVACAEGRIVFVGTAEECRREVVLDPGGRRFDARGGIILPGFVDAHTHLPFGGWREGEFAQRLSGASYLEIAAAGGGILSTVRATRSLLGGGAAEGLAGGASADAGRGPSEGPVGPSGGSSAGSGRGPSGGPAGGSSEEPAGPSADPSRSPSAGQADGPSAGQSGGPSAGPSSALSSESLAALIRARLDEMLIAGTTTVEAKSGYGLSLASEIGILRALALAGARHPVEVIPTFLGAHVVPLEFRAAGGRSDYVRLLVEEMIPRIAREGLARFCDVFVDEGAFTLEEARQILTAAARYGLGLRVHAEQLTHTGAAVLAASLGAFSADHLERLSDEDIATLAAGWGPGSVGAACAAREATAAEAAGVAGAIGAAGVSEAKRAGPASPAAGATAEVGPAVAARASGAARPPETTGEVDALTARARRHPGDATATGSEGGSKTPRHPPRGTVAVLLPGAAHFLRESARPPVRALMAAGVPVALATDFNPGTSPCLAMPPILSLACLLFGMTPDEAIIAATRHAALALGLEERLGTIEPGKQADLVVWKVPDRRHLAYRFGPIPCAGVVKNGRIVVEDGRRVTGFGPVSGPGEAVATGGISMLIDLTLREFLDTLASERPTPGGGSVAALAAAQAAALLEMVVALTLKSEKYASSRPALEPIRARAAAHRTDLATLVDRDAESYDAVLAASRLPKLTEEDKAARKAAREKALLYAAEIPLKTAELACAIADLAARAAPLVNPNAGSDVLVAAVLAEAALAGAAANVRINLEGLKSEAFAARANERLGTWTQAVAVSVATVRARYAG